MKKLLLVLLMGVSSVSVAEVTTISPLQACYLAGYYVEKGDDKLSEFWRLVIKEGPLFDGERVSKECAERFNEGVFHARVEK